MTEVLTKPVIEKGATCICFRCVDEMHHILCSAFKTVIARFLEREDTCSFF